MSKPKFNIGDVVNAGPHKCVIFDILKDRHGNGCHAYRLCEFKEMGIAAPEHILRMNTDGQEAKK